MADIEIRTATPFDAEELLGIYSYYIINTAVTYEIDVPSAEDFRCYLTSRIRIFDTQNTKSE